MYIKKIDNGKSKLNIIKCPHCGAEYLPSEIFMPDYITGKADIVSRDEKGIITYFENKIEPDLKETYICDYCNKEFKVTATIKYDSEGLENKQLEEDFRVAVNIPMSRRKRLFGV